MGDSGGPCVGDSEPIFIWWNWPCLLVTVGFVGGSSRCCGVGNGQPHVVWKIPFSPFEAWHGFLSC